MSTSTAMAGEAWRAYTSTGSIRPDLLRPHIYRSWERAHQQRINPHRIQPQTRTGLDLHRTIDEHLDFIEAAHPYLEAISRAMVGAQYAVGISAPGGTLIHLLSDEGSLEERGVLPPLGTLMDELVAGPNAYGTALAEGTCAEVNGPEHFVHDFQVHACFGLPVLRDGRAVAGALALAVRTPGQVLTQHRRLLEVASRGIEAELQAASLRRELRQLKVHASQPTQMFEVLHQDTVQDRSAGILNFELAAGAAAKRHESLISAASDAFTRHNRHARVWRLAAGLSSTQGPVTVEEVVVSAVELLRTEASMLRVSFQFDGAPVADGTVASAPLAMRVLSESFRMLRQVGVGGQVTMTLVDDGSLRWQALSREHPLEIEHRIRLR
jgi:transcriptional regulator of acetoin/glycerol metabolism